MRKLASALVGLIVGFWVAQAQAQSPCPNIATHAVLTAAQWQFCFTSKQNTLGYVPLNAGGGTMLGELITAASTTSNAGFNLPQGVAPTSPVNGDIWTTSSGIFVRINGSTINLTGASPATFAATGPLSVSFPGGIVTYACATCATTAGANLPAIATGDILYGSAANVLSALADAATGNVLISGGVGVAPSWGKVALTALAQSGANTMLGNWTGSLANVTANAMPSCADSGGNHLNYVSGTGITCGTSIPNLALASAHIFVGNGSNIATDVAMSGAISITNTGSTSFSAGTTGSGSIVLSASPTLSGTATAANLVVTGATLTFSGIPNTSTPGCLANDAAGHISAGQACSGGTALWTLSGSDIYYNAGNVAIGLTSPTSTLTVHGSVLTSGGDFDLRDAGTIISTAARVFSAAGNLYLQNGSGNNIYFRNKTDVVTAIIQNSGVVQLASYTTNGIATFTGGTGTITSKPGYTTSIIYGSDYGMVCDNSTDNQPFLQAAITATEALNAANNGNGGILQLPAGPCLINSGVTTTKPITIQGVGMGAGVQSSPGTGITTRVGATVIVAGFANGDLITATGLQGWTFKDMQFDTNITRTGGAAIHVISTYYNGNSNTQTKFERIQFVAQYDGILMYGPTSPVIQQSRFINWVHTGITMTEDPAHESSVGDIQNNFFFNLANCSGSDDAAITVHMGYGNIVNNQFDCGRIGIHWVVDSYAAGRLRIAGNVMEDHYYTSIYVENGGGVTASMLMIQNNEFSVFNATMDQHIEIVAGSAPWLDTVLISGNIFRSSLTKGGSTSFMNISSGTNVQITNNNLQGLTSSAYGILTGGNATSVFVGDNTFSGTFTSNYNLNFNTVLRDTTSGLTVSLLGVWANGSQVFVPNCKATNIGAGNYTVIAGGSGCMAVRQNGAWIVGGIN